MDLQPLSPAVVDEAKRRPEQWVRVRKDGAPFGVDGTLPVDEVEFSLPQRLAA
jgi:hypothetical protein